MITNNLKKIAKYLDIRFPIAEFSKELNMSKSAVSAYYNDKKRMSKNFQILLENRYDISISDFEENFKKIYKTDSLNFEVPLIPFQEYASFIEIQDDENKMENLFNKTYFSFKNVLEVQYFAFKVLNEGMNNGKIFDTPSSAIVLTSKIDRENWINDLKTENLYGYVLLFKTGIFHKDLELEKDQKTIICKSRNKSSEFPNFKIKIDNIHSLYKVLKREF